MSAKKAQRPADNAAGIKMAERMEIRKISELIPYANNARLHSAEQIELLRRSLREFGFVSPILIDGAGNVIAGHGRIRAAQLEGIEAAPCVLVEHLTDAQRRAYILADNRLAELSTWDEVARDSELLRLRGEGVDLTLTGFEDGEIVLGDNSEEYEGFVGKFQPKLTSDDCYTPANVYEAVKAWAVDRYVLQDAEILRPFWPGGDYQAADYPRGCVVIDNPPFSILSEICAWYDEHAVRYLLFCPGMTTFSINAGRSNYLPCGVSVMFDNGAEISISFVTNMGDAKIEIAPDLYAAVDAANRTNLAAAHADLPVYSYPDCVVSVAINKLAKYGQALRIPAEDAVFCRALDAQKEQGKAIYGGGFLLSASAAAEKAVAEKAAAEKAAALRWSLSDRERTLIASLGAGHG